MRNNTDYNRKWRREKAKDPAFRKRHADWMRKWRKKNPESYKASYQKYSASHQEIQYVRQAKHRIKIRQEALTHYGGKCICCGENRFQFLALHHVNGDGKDARKNINAFGGYQFVRLMRKQGYPSDIEIRCHNCHLAQHWYGSCPHQQFTSSSI